MTRARDTRAEIDAVLEVLHTHQLQEPGPDVRCGCGRTFHSVLAWRHHILTLAEGARLLSHDH